MKSLPAKFNNINENCLGKYKKSQQILEPIIHFSRGADNKIHSRLGVTRKHKSGLKNYFAVSNNHDWVLIEDVIYPLPSDISEQVSILDVPIADTVISYKKLLKIYNEPIETLEVFFDNNIFMSGNDQTKSFKGFSNLEGLSAKLYNYQSLGVDWMSNMLDDSGGVLLADEMGLGKTLQVIALLIAKDIKSLPPALIVCPKTLLRNWHNEFMKFAPSLNVYIHSGDGRTGSYKELLKPHIVLTTYETLVNDLILFKSFEWSFSIFDEAQHIKNPETKRRIAASQVASAYKLPMTGTPVENTLMDLWSLCDIAVPGLLGSVSEFRDNFDDTLDDASALSQITQSLILQRKVVDVAKDLPERIDIDVPLEFDINQKERYRAIRRETLLEYPKAGNLIATTRLQLFCTHPNLLDYDQEYVSNGGLSEMTPKLEYCLNILKEAFERDQKVLVFCYYNNFYDILMAIGQQELSGYWGKINGSTPEELRQSIVDEFSAYNGPGLLVLNPKAAGAGLNITAATIVIHYTQVWNPAVQAQASARAYRRGQSLPVRIYRLFYDDTVERVMIDRSHWKELLGNEAVPFATRDKTDLSRALEIEPEL